MAFTASQMAAADLLICRAGAMTLSEVAMMAKAAIFIPSPNVTENHQYHNAMSMVNKNAALIIEESALDGTVLMSTIKQLLKDKKRLENVGKNARAMAHIDATQKICDIVEGIAKK